MNNSFCKGAGVALITPFTKNSEVDYDSLESIIENQITCGIDFLVALGTTAETSTLTIKEKQSVIDFISEKTQNRVPIFVGIGGNDTLEVVERLQTLNLKKADGILSVVPYYNKPSQEGLFQHFTTIAKATSLPIILYNVPGRTSVHMSAATTLRLAHSSGQFVATKEASGNFQEICAILRDKPSGFTFLSGDDNLIVPTIALGGEGVISVAANVIPKGIANLTHYAMNGEFNKAAGLQLNYQTLLDQLFSEGNPSGVKAAMHGIGLTENQVRLPLVPVSNKLYQELNHEIMRLKLDTHTF